MRFLARRRRGLVAAVILVILVVIASVGTTIVRMSFAHRAAVESEERHSQVDWLVESGRLLGAARLRSDAGYRGETWKIPAGQLGGRGDAEVRVRVLAAPGGAAKILEVIARYPIQTSTAVQRTARFTIPSAS